MTGLTEIVSSATRAAGCGDADWRVQAGAAALLIVAGVLAWNGKRIINKVKRRKQ